MLPGSTDAAFAVKTERFPPYGLPPLRQGADALLTAHSIRIGDRTGNLPLFPGIFPDQMAPIVRTGSDGERELVMARWGMPGPPQYGGAPVTKIRVDGGLDPRLFGGGSILD